MNSVQLTEYHNKLERLRSYAASRNADSVILSRRDNFSWLTSGGDNSVVRSTEAGAGVLVVLQDRVYLVAYVMDADRILDDEMDGTGVEVVRLKWHEGSLEDRARSLAGGGLVLSDAAIAGTQEDRPGITALHYPLSDREIQLCRALGADSERIIRRTADRLHPDMTEREAAALLAADYAAEGIGVDVLLVGGSERISKYRHPLPSSHKIGTTVLLHPAVQKHGLHANVTRMVQLGKPTPPSLEKAYTALCQLQTMTLALCEPGREFSEIFQKRRELLADSGYPNEWENHFPGGPTGYVLACGDWGSKKGIRVSEGQVFDWFITITGAKVEELTLTHQGRREILSQAGFWPTRTFTSGGLTLEVPWILEK